MKESDLPDPEDRSAVLKFAASFNGYQHFGSFKNCADEAKARKRSTVIDLRNELFFFYRAANHQGEPCGVVECYRELLPYFRLMLKE